MSPWSRLRIVGFGLIILSLAGWMFPGARLWGVHHVAFLHPALSAILLAAAALCFMGFGGEWIGKRIAALRSFRIPAVVIALIAGAIFLGVRVREPLLGDGQLLLRHLVSIGRLEARDYPVYDIGRARWSQAGETFLHETAFRIAAAFHPPLSPDFSPDQDENEVQAEVSWFFERARWTYILESIAAGMLFVFLVIRFARRVLPPDSRLVFLLTMFGAGGMLVFFGYVEDYAWTALAMVATLLFGIEEVRNHTRWPWKTLLFFVIAACLHLAGLILAPAVLYAFIANRIPTLRFRLWMGIMALTAGALMYVIAQSWADSLNLLPVLPGMARDGYSLFSPQHLLNLLNLALLLTPLALMAAFLRDAKRESEQPLQMLQIAAVSGMAFALLFDPDLGMPRDWDLYSMALWPVVLLTAWTLSRIPWTERDSAPAILLGFALLTLVPMAAVNANTNAAVARFETVLELDPSRAAYGWENLAAYHRREQDSDNAIRALRRATEVDENPRYKLGVADELRRAGRLEESEPWYLAATRTRPDYVKKMIWLCQSYARRGDNDKAIAVVRTMNELEPGNPVYIKLLSDLERATGRAPSEEHP